ncbi:hypothetical protein UY3_16856 [Chelonia mydas]|uniref:Myb/SANT-like DNA-binding domain-containing protein n=1 Tax=Chelonia mydas TaxID=8469 RepID=M7AT22_CHEMY|nr:hypothetical protein UY3_16856 [Chelonia mydas]
MELFDLLGLWGEKAGQLQLCSSHRNLDICRQIACGLPEKRHERGTQQCRTKSKKLRQAYQKAREGNQHSDAALKTRHFYKELHVTLGSDPTAMSPLNSLRGLEAVASGVNPEDEVVDEEVELEEDVGNATGLSGDRTCSATQRGPGRKVC